MTLSATFRAFERLSDQIGGEAALKLVAWYGATHGRVAVPNHPREGHVLERLLGRKAFCDLVRAFGGETIYTPRVDLSAIQTAAKVWSLTKLNVSRQHTASLLGISAARVGQIVNGLNQEGWGDLEAFSNAGLSSAEVTA